MRLLALTDLDGRMIDPQVIAEADQLDDPWLMTYLHVLQGTPTSRQLVPDALASLVNGRTVALVGSATMSTPHGHDIDAADVVVRTKFFGNEYLQDRAISGSRTTIAYYNKAATRTAGTLSRQTDGDALRSMQSLSLVVAKREFRIDGVPVVPMSARCPLYLSHAVLGVRAILELLAARPHSLRVFGMDFYLSEQPHFDGDRSELERKKSHKVRDNAHYCLAFAQHDPFSQIRFVRHLAEAGAITPYGRTAEVLAMTDLEYAKGLETRYGRWDQS